MERENNILLPNSFQESVILNTHTAKLIFRFLLYIKIAIFIFSDVRDQIKLMIALPALHFEAIVRLIRINPLVYLLILSRSVDLDSFIKGHRKVTQCRLFLERRVRDDFSDGI